MEIKNFEDLIKPILLKNKRYLGSRTSKLTVAGDNYGSLMSSVIITLEDEKGEIESVHAVAKMVPTNPLVQTLYNVQRTFTNEVGFYRTIAPCLQKFQMDHGLKEVLSSFPRFYGARLCLDSESAIVNEDGVLLIENLKSERFYNIDRRIGFNLEQAKLILRKMVELHGSVMALKMQKSEIFDCELNRYFKEFKVFDIGDRDTTKMINTIINIIKDDEECVQNMQKIRGTLEINGVNIITRNNKEFQKGSFLSMIHGDMWSNNILIKIMGNKTIDVKFVDYQLYEYSSVTRDLIYFLFTSVQLPILRKHCDELLHFYFDVLIAYLQKLQYDTLSLSYENFLSDIKFVIETYDFFHVMLMMAPIYAQEKDTKEVEEMDEDDIIHVGIEVSDQCKERACFTVHEFLRRGWL